MEAIRNMSAQTHGLLFAFLFLGFSGFDPQEEFHVVVKAVIGGESEGDINTGPL